MMTDTRKRKHFSLSTLENKTKIKIKLPKIKTAIKNRRSKRRRSVNILLSKRNSSSSSLSSLSALTASPHQNDSVNSSRADRSDNQNINNTLAGATKNKLVFTTTSSKATQSSYWTVTDRQPEWYKLSIPINQVKQIPMVPFNRLLIPWDANKSNANDEDLIDQPSDPTQLIMKTVMRELDYDMDDNDMNFLKKLNRTRRIENKRRQLNEQEFENAMIILEFSTAEKVRSCLKHKLCEDRNIVCDICLLPDGDEGNEMVFCERCHCCVHQNCYGIPVLPSGTWYCRPCSILRRPACILCPKLGGPMKCTASGTIWCHLTCVLWLPELKFVDYSNMEPILHLNKIPHGRWSLRCVVCSTSEGACVQCAHKNCRTPFHVTCGLAAGYFLDIQQTTSKESAISHSQFNAYCSKHSDEARKHSQDESINPLKSNDSDDDDDDDDSSRSSTSSSLSPSPIPFTIYRRNQLKIEQWMPECLKRISTFISSSYLHEECPQDYDEDLSRNIYEYWISKRQMNQFMPLIKHIDYVFEQRENAELLISQINNCLQIKKTMLQLQDRCKSMLDSSASAESLIQRFESLKNAFSSSIHHRRRGHTRHSSHSANKHENKPKNKSFNRRHQKLLSSTTPQDVAEEVKQCCVKLESTYRHQLELDTTYIIGTTIDQQMILVPKKLIDQKNIIAFEDDSILQQSTMACTTLLDHSNTSDQTDDDDDNDVKSVEKTSIFMKAKTPYASQGNIVTCVTGSFD